MSLQSTKTKFRGGTVFWETTFYDEDDVIVQPVAAFININYPNPDGSRASQTIQMTPPSLSEPYWTVSVETRNMGTGPFDWSIHSQGPTFVGVEDGSFVLTANPANLVNFP